MRVYKYNQTTGDFDFFRRLSNLNSSSFPYHLDGVTCGNYISVVDAVQSDGSISTVFQRLERFVQSGKLQDK